MFPLEQGAFEMVLIGAIALIVVGPKDLPILMRRIGQFTAKMRGMAAEFRASFEELAQQSELDELRKEVEALRTGQSTAPVAKDIQEHFDNLHAEFKPPTATDAPSYGELAPAPEAEPELFPGLTPAAAEPELPLPAPKPRKLRAKTAAVAANGEAPPAVSPKPRKPRAPKAAAPAPQPEPEA